SMPIPRYNLGALIGHGIRPGAPLPAGDDPIRAVSEGKLNWTRRREEVSMEIADIQEAQVRLSELVERALDPQITNRAPPGGPVGPGSHWAVRSPGSDEPRAAYQGCDPVNRGIWGTSDSRTMAASWTINCDL